MDGSVQEECWGIAQVTVHPQSGGSFTMMIERNGADEQAITEMAHRNAREGKPPYSVIVNFTLIGLSQKAYDAVKAVLKYSRGRELTFDDLKAAIEGF